MARGLQLRTSVTRPHGHSRRGQMKKPKTTETAIEIIELTQARLAVYLVGTTPLIMHRFDSKAQGELLLPKPKKNRASRASTLKHDPVEEFRASVYLNRDPNVPTAIHFPANAFGSAIADAAVDIPGSTKAQIQRLCSVCSTEVQIYGVPKLWTRMVRLHDFKNTPDMHTRALFPQWCCRIEVEFVATLLKEGQIANLIAAAGIIRGVGDWRPQKAGQYGKWRLAEEDDKEMLQIMKAGGRAAQIAALEHPVAADTDTSELLDWFKRETTSRELKVPSDRGFSIEERLAI